MKDDIELIEKRLKNVKNFYLKTEEIINGLSDVIPQKVKKELIDKILGDEELKELMDGIENNRPPRILLYGRTGVGKSSIINALCDSYLAKVSDTISCTTKTECYQCKKGKKVVMEIMDTRGIAESLTLDDKITAEEVLVNDMKKFSPDVAILVLNATHRDDVNKDVNNLKKIADEYKKINSIDLPIIVVINKCDEVAPTIYKNPKEYTEKKLNNINKIRDYFKDIIVENNLNVIQIVSISSLVQWENSEGVEISPEEIEELNKEEIEKLHIGFDGRYNIDILLEELEKAIQNNGARMGLRLAARLDSVLKNISKKLNDIFSSLSATVALTPIPVSDIYVLLILQMILISLIASLSGRDINMDTAKEFVFSMGGIAGLGHALKIIAQQGSKFLNLIFPGSGSFVSSAVAYSGTHIMGDAAIEYYINNKSIKEVQKLYKNLSNKEKNKSK